MRKIIISMLSILYLSCGTQKKALTSYITNSIDSVSVVELTSNELKLHSMIKMYVNKMDTLLMCNTKYLTILTYDADNRELQLSYNDGRFLRSLYYDEDHFIYMIRYEEGILLIPKVHAEAIYKETMSQRIREHSYLPIDSSYKDLRDCLNLNREDYCDVILEMTFVSNMKEVKYESTDVRRILCH